MTVADYMRQVHTWCKEYVENFEKKGGNLIFTGSTGVGKTFLTNCIAKALIDQYQSVIYLSSNDLFDVFLYRIDKGSMDTGFAWCPLPFLFT